MVSVASTSEKYAPQIKINYVIVRDPLRGSS